MRWLRRYWPVLAWAAAIWAFSTETFSFTHTSRLILPVLHWLFPQASAETLEWMHFVIRKSAHLVEYFIFSLLVLHAIRGERKGWQWQWGLIAIAVAAGYAAVDELHQAFEPTRGPSLWDVGLDTLGAALAQLSAASWSFRRRPLEAERVELHDGAPPGR
jgi:VanZ family protein